MLKQKLTSRKFWAAVLAAALSVIAAVFADELGASVTDALGSGVAALIAYIFGESAVDAVSLITSKKR